MACSNEFLILSLNACSDHGPSSIRNITKWVTRREMDFNWSWCCEWCYVFVVILELILPYYSLLFEDHHAGRHYYRSFANHDCLWAFASRPVVGSDALVLHDTFSAQHGHRTEWGLHCPCISRHIWARYANSDKYQITGMFLRIIDEICRCLDHNNLKGQGSGSVQRYLVRQRLCAKYFF